MGLYHVSAMYNYIIVTTSNSFLWLTAGKMRQGQIPKTHRNQSQAQLQLSEPENPPGEKLKKT